MPHSVIFCTAEDTPRKWQCNTPGLSPSVCCSQQRAVSALLRVSMVVKDLDEMMNSVEWGLRVRSNWDSWLPSMVEAKCTVRREEVCAALSHRASTTICGPRSEPPTPIFTTSVTTSPVAPRHCPECTLFTMRSMRRNCSCTWAETSWPSTTQDVSAQVHEQLR